MTNEDTPAYYKQICLINLLLNSEEEEGMKDGEVDLNVSIIRSADILMLV